jgi:hypothetical protein
MTHGLNEPAQRAADRLVIVDDVDESPSGVHDTSAGIEKWNVTP